MRLIKAKLSLFKYAYFLKAILKKNLNFIFIRSTHLEIYIFTENLLTCCRFLKLNSNSIFASLNDITAVDFIRNKKRFKISYNFWSNFQAIRLFVQIFLGEQNFVGTLTNYFKSANWAEREVWDLYGIYFLNHSDLRRILTDYGFKGFPFRKDFPLTGYIELRYDDQKGDIVYEPVELSQELRFFNFATGWESD